MSEQHLPIHPRERLPLPAVPILDTSPKLDLQSGRLFFSQHEFEYRIVGVCIQFWKIQTFAKFVKDNHRKSKDKHLVYCDLV